MTALEKMTIDHFAFFDKMIAKDYGNAPCEALPPLSANDQIETNYQSRHLSKERPSYNEVMFWNGSLTSFEFWRNVNAFCKLKPFTINPVILYNNGSI